MPSSLAHSLFSVALLPFRTFKKVPVSYLFCLVLLLGSVSRLSAQIQINNTSAVVQNFDALPTASPFNLPTGWKMSAAGAGITANYNDAGNFTQATLAHTSTSTIPAAGRIVWATNSDRALGVYTSGAYVSPNSIMAEYTNNTGTAITQILMSYNGQRRITSSNNTAYSGNPIDLYFSTDGSNWTLVPASINLSSGVNAFFNSATAGASVIDLTTVSVRLAGLNIEQGNSVFFKWVIKTLSGATHWSFALDDVSLTASTTAAVADLPGIGNSIDFNSMGTSGTASMPAGFYAVGQNLAAITATTQAAGTTGTGVLTGTSAGGTYNFANGVTASSADRSLGFLTSTSYPGSGGLAATGSTTGSGPVDIVYGIRNTTGATITSLTLGWNYEKYRSGTNAFSWEFSHGSSVFSTMTVNSNGSQSYTADANNTTISNPPSSITKSVSLTGLNIPAGGIYYVRWRYSGAAYTNSQGIGIDDFKIAPGDAYVAHWPLTLAASGTGVSTQHAAQSVGNVTSGNATYAGVTTVNATHSQFGQNANGWATARNTGRYFQYQVTAPVDRNLSIEAINFSASTNTGTASWGLYYSFDNFGTETQIGSNTSTTSTSFAPFSYTPSALTVPAGQTVTLRLFAWHTSATAFLNLRDFVVRGTSTIAGGNFWDANGATAGVGGTGTWTSTSSTWAQLADGTGGGVTQGTGNLTFGGTAGTVTVSGTVNAAAAKTFNTDGYSFTGGTINLTGASAAANTLTLGNSINTSIGSVLSGTNGFTKAGAGVLTLTGSNTITGNINISGGTLIASGAVPSILNNRPIDISSGATLRFSANSDFQQPNQTITGAGTIEQNGLRISPVGNINGHTGDVIINSGDYDSRTGQAIGNTSRVIINSPGKLTVVLTADETVGTVEGDGTIDFFGAGNPRLLLSGNTDRILSGTIIGNASSPNTDATTGSGVLIKNGTGALTLSGSNTFTGGITLNTGTLNLANAAALGTGRFYINGGLINNTSGSSLSLSTNNSQTWGGDFGFTGTNDLTIGTAQNQGSVLLTGNRSISVVSSSLLVNSVISGSYGITKAGNGSLRLRGSNTFSGGVTVNAGYLFATGSTSVDNGSNSNTGTGPVLVESGATIGGTQQIGHATSGTVTIQSGGFIAPGAPNPVSSVAYATLRTYGSLIINGTYNCEFNGTNTDRITVDGTLTLSGATLELSGSSITAPLIIASYASLSGTFSTVNGLPAGYTLDYNYNGLNQIALVVITSPTINANPGILSGVLTTTYGTASASQSFTVSGSSLTNNLVVTAPAGLEVSTDNTNFSSSVSLTPSSGTVNITTIYVRIAATAAVGSYNDLIIAITSTGATQVTVSTTSSGNTVSAKELTVTGITGDNKVYDRTTNATVTGTASLNGVVGSDNVILDGTPTFTFASANVANGIAITVGGYTISGPAAGNYTLTQPAGLTGNITPKELTVSNAAVTTKSFDGNTQATITGATLNGVISPDVVTISNLGIAGSGTFASADPGTGIAVTANLILGGAAAANYSITQPTGLTGTITPVTQTGDAFRSRQTGNWNDAATWESFTFGNWVNATTTPTNSNAGTITIRENHIVTVTAGVTVDQVTIDALGQVTVNASQTLTVADGTGVDLIINGTYLNQGTISTTGTWQINSGGTFIHNATTGIATPMNSGTFNNGSTFIFRSAGTAVSITGRTFGNLRFETSTGSISTSPAGTGGVTINNDLFIASNVTLSLTSFSGTTTIGGNVTIDGTLTLDADAPGVAGNWTNNGTFNAGTSTVTINGTTDQSISGSSTFNNLTINKSSGAVNLQANQSVGGTLALTAGSVNVGSSTLTHTGASVTRASSGTITTSSTGVFAVNSTSSYTLPAGTLTGTTLLTKNNSGSLTLNSQSHSGGVTLTAGTIVVAANDALGSGTFTINGGTVNTDATARSITNAISIGGSFTFTGTNSLTQSTGAITFTATPTITASSNTLTLGGVISGGFGITKAGAGTLTLSNTNTYTGATTINAGTLSVPTLANGGANSSIGASTNAAANLILGGGTLLYTGPDANTDRNFTLTASTTSTINTTNDLTISGASTNTTGALTKLGAGTLILTGANSHTGTTTITTGTLQIGNGGTTGSVAGNIVKNANLIFDRSDDFTYAGVISGTTGSLTKRGAGVLTLSGTNTSLNGGVFIEQGTLSIASLGNNLNYPTNALTFGSTVTAGTLLYNGVGGTAAGGFTVNAGGGVLTNSATTNDLTFSGNITNNGPFTLSNTSPRATILSGIISGGGSVTVNNTGTGVTTFSGNNTYTGTTTLTGGILQLGLANRIPDASNFILNGGTLRTGATTGFAESVGTLDLDANSTIALGTGNHTLTFANSSGVAWNSSATLTITGWTGTAGQSGSAGKIVVGAGGLTDDQLAQITFSGYCAGAMIVGTEMVPKGATLAAYITQLTGTIEKGTTDAPIAGFTMTNGVSATFGGITVTGAIATSSDVTNVRIFRDNNGNGLIDGADAVVSDALSFGATMNFTISGETFSGSRNYLIVADISGTATAASVQVIILSGAFSTYCAAGNVGTVGQVTRPLVNSSSSDVIRSTAFSEPQNILYAQYQTNAIQSSGAGNGNIKIGEFVIRDGGAAASDLDGFSTTVTALSFTLANHTNIRRLTLYDNATSSFIGTEQTGTATVNFSGLNIVVPDNGTRVISIYASFTTAVTDNQQISLTVSSVTAPAAGSGFAAANGGGAATSTTGDDNRIEVVADRVQFVQQPTNTILNGTMAPAVTVQAGDVNNIRDLDYTASITISSTGTLTGNPVSVNAVSGLASFDALVHTAEGTGLVLNASGTALTTGSVSNTFDITLATAPVVITGTLGTVTDTQAPITTNNVTSDGGSPITERGVVYSIGALPTILDSKLTSSGTLGTFNSTITGLTPGTIYYARAYATNAVGTGYGAVVVIATSRTITFRDGLNGYTGTEDTYVRSTSPTTSFGSSTIVEVDQDPQDHGLFRFSNIVGCGTNQIPLNAQITSATFSFTVIEPGEGTRVFRMNGNWTESSTWNSLVNGVNIGTETPSTPIITFGSSDGSTSDFVNGIYNVTGIASIVQEWVNGTADNNGFAIINFPLSNDGADIASSENGTQGNRPTLTVTYRPVVSGEVYRSIVTANGNWSVPGNWEFAPTTSGPWNPACSFPTTSNSSQVIIQSGSRIVLDINNTVDQISVDGELELGVNNRLTVMNGNTGGVDMTINGTMVDRGASSNGLLFEDNNGTTNDASLEIGSSATIIKTNQSSVQNYATFYQGGMNTIPSTANWYFRNNGDGTVATAAVGMYYPNLYFENTVAGNYSFNTFTSALRGNTGGFTTVKGNMFVGTTGSGSVTLHNNNLNSQPMLIEGNLTVGSSSTLTNVSYDGITDSQHGNGTGFELISNLTVEGTFTNDAGNGLLRMTGTNDQTIGGTGTINLRDVTVNKTSGTVTLNRDLTVGNALSLTSGTLSVSTQSLTLNGAVTATGGTLTSAATGTVVYNQSSEGQTVIPADYGNLTFSNFNKLLPGTGNTVGVAGSFVPGSATGHTITGSTINFNGSGAQTISVFNYFNLSVTGDRSNNILTLAPGTIGVAGDFTAAVTGVSNYAVTGNTVDFNGTSSQTIGAPFNFNNLTISGNKNGGTITLGNGVIGVAGNFATSGATGVASYVVTGNTVDFNGADQSIGEFTFNNLSTSNSGTKQFTGTGFANQVSGTTANLLGTFTIGTNTSVQMNNYGMQVGLGGSVAVNGILDFNGGTNGFISRITGVGEVSTMVMGTNGLIRTNNPNGLGVGATSSIRNNGAGTMTQTSVGTTGTVEYYGADQTVTNRSGAGGYYNLLIAGSGIKTINGNTPVNGALSINNGTLAVSTFALTLNSSIAVAPGALLSAASGIVNYYRASNGQAVHATNYGNLNFNDFSKILPSTGIVGVSSIFSPGTDESHTITGSTLEFNGSLNQFVPYFNYHHLTLKNGATKTLADNLAVAGNFTVDNNGGTTSVIPGTNIRFNGNNDQSIAGLPDYRNIQFSGTSGFTKTFTGNASVFGTVSFPSNNSNDNGIIDIDGPLDNLLFTFRSNSLGTARLDQVKNWNVTGKAVIERYVPSQRRWRLMSIPTLPGETLRQAWTRQADGSYPAPNCFGSVTEASQSGTLITGHSMSSCTNAVNAGFDHVVTGGSSSIRFYNSAASNPWASATSTPNVLAPPTEYGYLLFVRGDRNTLNVGSDSTTLRPLGGIKQNNQSFTINSPFKVVGNPYPSSVNLDFIYSNAGNSDAIERNFYIWDANSGTQGGYRVLSWDGVSSYTCSGCDGLSAENLLVVHSGQAIIVERKANTTSTNLIISESNKTASATGLPFRTNGVGVSQIRIDLYRAAGSALQTYMDGAVGRFNNLYSAGTNEVYDIYKNNQFDENISLVRDNKYLSIESRPIPTLSDTLFVPFYFVTNRDYALKLKADFMNNLNLTAVIQDAFTGTETILPLNGSEFVYPFTVTSNAASRALNRLRIVFRPGATLPVRFLNVNAKVAGSSNILNWQTSFEQNISRFEIERSINGLSFEYAGKVQPLNRLTGAAYEWNDLTPFEPETFYRVKSVDLDGTLHYSNIVKVSRGQLKREMRVQSMVSGSTIKVQMINQPAGQYNFRLYTVTGQHFDNKLLFHSGGSSVIDLRFSNTIQSAGVYLLSVQMPDGTSETFRLHFNQ
jgi:fibronectin-binding autotransporter adhesin